MTSYKGTKNTSMSTNMSTLNAFLTLFFFFTLEWGDHLSGLKYSLQKIFHYFTASASWVALVRRKFEIPRRSVYK